MDQINLEHLLQIIGKQTVNIEVLTSQLASARAEIQAKAVAEAAKEEKK